jgi:hypothetical protein
MPTFPILLLFAIAVAMVVAFFILGRAAARPVPQRARQAGSRGLRRRPF